MHRPLTVTQRPLCPERTAIVPTDKGLIQHILSPGETVDSRSQAHTPQNPHLSALPLPLILCSSASLPRSLSLSRSLQFNQRRHQREPRNKAKGRPASQEFEELFWGFHRGNSCHVPLDNLSRGLERGEVNGQRNVLLIVHGKLMKLASHWDLK